MNHLKGNAISQVAHFGHALVRCRPAFESRGISFTVLLMSIIQQMEDCDHQKQATATAELKRQLELALFRPAVEPPEFLSSLFLLSLLLL